MEPRQRRDVAARTVAAVIGGYVVTALATAFLARGLPLPRSEATAAATLLSFVIYTTVAIGAFTARTATVVWLRLIAAAAVLAAALPFVGKALQ